MAKTAEDDKKGRKERVDEKCVAGKCRNAARDIQKILSKRTNSGGTRRILGVTAFFTFHSSSFVTREDHHHRMSPEGKEKEEEEEESSLSPNLVPLDLRSPPTTGTLPPKT